jgi:thiol-disulfide isomerase/thioredoxin
LPSPSLSPTVEEKDDGDAATIFTEDGTEIAWDRAPDKPGSFKVKKAGKAAQALGWKKGDEVSGDGTGPWRESVHEALSALKAMGTGSVKRDQGSLELPYFFASDDQIESSPHGLRPMKEPWPVIGQGEHGRVDLVKKARGRPLLINFWASWCGPCQKEMPAMERLSKAYAGRVWFLGLNVDEGKPEVVEFLKKYPITYPTVMIGNMRSETAQKYYVDGIPLTVILRADGRIALVGAGYRGEGHEKWIADALDTLLKPDATPSYLIHKPVR